MARPRSDIRPRIVDAARARFLAAGVDGASLREIARDAGTNIGMIVYYFPTKDDLFLAVVEDVYEGIVRDLELSLGADATTRERLRRAVVRLGAVDDRELEVIRLLAREVLLSSTRFERVLARFRRGHLALFVAAVADGVRRGEFDSSVPMPLLVLAVIGLGGVPQLIRRAAGELPPFDSLPGPEDLADATIDLLFRAVGAAKAGARPRKTARTSVAQPRARTTKTR